MDSFPFFFAERRRDLGVIVNRLLHEFGELKNVGELLGREYYYVDCLGMQC